MDAYLHALKQIEYKNNIREKIALYYNKEVQDFSKEISMNRDDELSDFAKAIRQLYHYKDKK